MCSVCLLSARHGIRRTLAHTTVFHVEMKTTGPKQPGKQPRHRNFQRNHCPAFSCIIHSWNPSTYTEWKLAYLQPHTSAKNDLDFASVQQNHCLANKAFYTLTFPQILPQTFLHTTAFTHKVPQKKAFLHAGTFTDNRFFTHVFTRNFFYTQRLLHTKNFTIFLHHFYSGTDSLANAFTHRLRCFCTFFFASALSAAGRSQKHELKGETNRPDHSNRLSVNSPPVKNL